MRFRLTMFEETVNRNVAWRWFLWVRPQCMPVHRDNDMAIPLNDSKGIYVLMNLQIAKLRYLCAELSVLSGPDPHFGKSVLNLWSCCLEVRLATAHVINFATVPNSELGPS